MSLFNKHNSLVNVIRCDEPSYLIRKWHPEGTDPAKSKRANSIRWGSSLRVKEGSVAVFVYSQDNGFIQEYIEGPCDIILKTANLPVLTSIIGAAYGGDSPFQAEIYFINLAEIIQIKFGVPFFDVFDPRFLDFGVPTAVRGTISFKITDYREFIRLHRLDSFSLEDFKAQSKDAVVKSVKHIVTNAPESYGIPAVQIERQVSQINQLVETELKDRLFRDFGVTVSGVDISDVEIDKTSEGYRQLKAVTQDVSTATIQAKTAVDIKKMQDTQRIEAEHMEGILKAQREEAQYAQRIKTQSEHLTTHQLNQQAAVGIAGAEALGKMGAAGGTDIAGSMNPAGMMAGMAIGGMIGQNLAGMMGGMMSGMKQPLADSPPPIPAASYYVAVNGQPSGPFDLTTLTTMAANGQLQKDSLVWCAGMEQWLPARTIPALQILFHPAPNIPPISQA